VEFTGPAAVKYQHLFVPNLLNYLGDSSAEVRQAAAYGCGIMAQFGGETFAEACKEAMPRLALIVANPEARGEDNISATENAISAVGKIIKFNPNCVNLDETVPVWLSWLPIWEDKDEMESVYGYLCELLESNSPAALGPQGSNLPHIVRVIAEIFARNVLAETSPTKPRLVTLLRMIQANDQLFQSCFVQLSPELQQSLQGALQV
jgi:hypothetical protein